MLDGDPSTDDPSTELPNVPLPSSSSRQDDRITQFSAALGWFLLVEIVYCYYLDYSLTNFLLRAIVLTSIQRAAVSGLVVESAGMLKQWTVVTHTSISCLQLLTASVPVTSTNTVLINFLDDDPSPAHWLYLLMMNVLLGTLYVHWLNLLVKRESRPRRTTTTHSAPAVRV